MKRSTFLLAGTLACLVFAHGEAAEPFARLQVTAIKPLLMRAIDEGSAHGVLVGEAATYVRQKFDASASIEIDVREIGRAHV